jgi:DNA ligase-associated metallophosphoesterase
MSDALATDIAGERVHLFADRALFWPREHALLIADLHLGKADTFRSAGIPLPSGGTRHDLERITRLIERTEADRLIVLGDMLHSDAVEVSWRLAWETWRQRHRDLRIDVVAGNHDRSLQRTALDVHVHPASMSIAPFMLRHAPADDATHVMCGHLHPVVRIPGALRRWPAFMLDENQTILPAFSAFTGGTEIEIGQERLAVCHRDGSDIAMLDAVR